MVEHGVFQHDPRGTTQHTHRQTHIDTHINTHTQTWWAEQTKADLKQPTVRPSGSGWAIQTGQPPRPARNQSDEMQVEWTAAASSLWCGLRATKEMRCRWARQRLRHLFGAAACACDHTHCTKEMMQPCLIYLLAISLVPHRAHRRRRRRRRRIGPARPSTRRSYGPVRATEERAGRRVR